mmetsp:Transcript_8390/g.14029  ORF Transcript_8390/g.14029 Transcript_8390/m.14029 type:complete len:81 (+) Transcript_8390:1350-1592(+)
MDLSKEDIIEHYTNVNTRIEGALICYITLSSLIAFIYVLEIFFKGRKGLIGWLRRVTIYMPIIYVMVIIYFFNIMNDFTT